MHVRECECVKKLRELRSRIQPIETPGSVVLPPLPLPSPFLPLPLRPSHPPAPRCTARCSPLWICVFVTCWSPPPRPLLQPQEAGTVPPPRPGTQKRGHSAQVSRRGPKAGPSGRVSAIGSSVLCGSLLCSENEEPALPAAVCCVCPGDT